MQGLPKPRERTFAQIYPTPAKLGASEDGERVAMDAKKTADYVQREWNDNVIPSLMDFVRIPNVSPAFDQEWDTNGFQMQAFDLVTKWAEAQKIPNCKIELIKETGRTPLLIMEIEAHQSERSCMLYAHIDKQPPMGVWMEGLGPYEPAVKEGKLYGRGAVDDGYGFYCAITSIKAIKAQGLPWCARASRIDASPRVAGPTHPSPSRAPPEPTPSSRSHLRHATCRDAAPGS